MALVKRLRNFGAPAGAHRRTVIPERGVPEKTCVTAPRVPTRRPAPLREKGESKSLKKDLVDFGLLYLLPSCLIFFQFRKSERF